MSDLTHLVFVPSIGLSHILPTIELAKRLVKHHHAFSVTFLIVSIPYNPITIDSVASSAPSFRFIPLSPADLPPPGTEPGVPFLSLYIQNHQSVIKQTLTQLISDSHTANFRLVVDMFSSTVIDVGKELGIPSYVYFTTAAAMVGLMLHLPTLDSEIATEFIDHSTELTLPSYTNPVPTLCLPNSLLNKKSDSYSWYLKHGRKYKESKGIIVNSVLELEPKSVYALNHLIRGVPRVYPVSPMLDLEVKTRSGANKVQYDRIMKWLDDQPEASVVFLCFGTRGALSEEQVKEIAGGLERSGQRFVWSLRCPPTVKFGKAGEYTNFEEILPGGFLERTSGKGMVCGWAPQVDVLAHKATGGFVSHCGWNSVLEGLWFGVPILTWPLDAEQKLNAFELVVDLGLAVEMKREGVDLVAAEDVERGVRRIIEGEDEVRKRVKAMSEKCRKATTKGGSSWSSLECLVEDFSNAPVIGKGNLALA